MDKAFRRYQKTRSEFWDKVASTVETAGSRHYHSRLTKVYRFLVRPGLRVLELGCGTGDLLAALDPEYGVGVDFSHEPCARFIRQHIDNGLDAIFTFEPELQDIEL